MSRWRVMAMALILIFQAEQGDTQRAVVVYHNHKHNVVDQVCEKVEVSEDGGFYVLDGKDTIPRLRVLNVFIVEEL